jgi:hypothetical protein
LLGPNIDGISEGFAEAFNAVFYKSDYSLVDSREDNVYEQHKDKFGISGKKKEYKETVLFELLESLCDEQTIIYCSSPNRVRYISKAFASYLEQKSTPLSTKTYPLSDWIKTFIADDWSLLTSLTHDIGIHDGALQKHITTSIIDYFNTGDLKYLFCTSTIIEGVNTSAKNIVYLDETKGRNNPVDYFDYSNIKGRAGRMMVHYVGKIFNFNKPPERSDILIDIPFFQQNPIKDEVLIQIDESNVKHKDTEQYKTIVAIPANEKELIKNNGLSVHGQKSIIDILRERIQPDYSLIAWTDFPKYPQLSYVLNLAWDYLALPGDIAGSITKSKLVKMTFDYGYNKNINYLIDSQFNYDKGLDRNKNRSDADLRDEAIQIVFQAMKHWFQYKVPKWLSVMNELQRFICNERGLRCGSYSYYANLIENDFIRENLTILLEYGIPSSAIRKLENSIPKELHQDNVLNYIREHGLNQQRGLLQYEQIKITENI